jgi:NADH dehydrogenase FAD-containing subunit
MQKPKFTGYRPVLGAERQRPAIVGTGSTGVKVIAALRHALYWLSQDAIKNTLGNT